MLVVCTGNTCRSPLAEWLLQDRLGDLAVVRSAGVRGLDSAPMESAAAAELRRLGGDPTDFRSRRLSGSDVTGADLVLTMTAAHRSEVLAEAPTALSRTFTLREFAHLLDGLDAPFDPASSIAELARRRGSATLEDYDVEDPIGQPAVVHAHVADRIVQAVDTIAPHLRPSE